MSVEMNLEVLDDHVAGNLAEEMRRLIREECRIVNAEEFKQSLNVFYKIPLVAGL
jgi:hypothetical protein